VAYEAGGVSSCQYERVNHLLGCGRETFMVADAVARRSGTDWAAPRTDWRDRLDMVSGMSSNGRWVV
jgi:hypothetical protein